MPNKSLRDLLLMQEIDRIQSKVDHHDRRVRCGSADDEDLEALAFYLRVLAALKGMESPNV